MFLLFCKISQLGEQVLALYLMIYDLKLYFVSECVCLLLSLKPLQQYTPSKQLTLGKDLYCFKNHIKPNWKDPIYANGGKWTATFQKGKSDNAWMYSVTVA